jgi:O-antigen/teichoic acid export membrane protein
MSQRQKTLSGFKWTFLNQLVTQIVLFVLGIYLMRLLPPESFGTLGMVTVFAGIVGLFSDFGLHTSLIQKKKIDEFDKDTVFWISLLLSFFLGLILFFSAGAIEKFYNDLAIGVFAQVLSSNFIIQGLGNLNTTLLRREMKYKELFIMRSSSVLMSGLVAVVLAYKGFGIWSLIFQTLLSSFIFSSLSYVFSDYRPSLNFKYSLIKDHLKFGLPVFGTRVTLYGADNADKFLIGKFINAESLGIYSRAFTLVSLPIHHLSQVITSVMFSSFSLIQDDIIKIDLQQKRITRILLYIVSPILGVWIISAEQIVLILVGEDWLEAAPVIKILGFGVFFKVMITLRTNILWALGKSNFEMYFSIISAIIVLLAQLIGVRYGILGVAYALSIALMILTLPSFILVGITLNTKVMKQLGNVFIPFTLFSISVIIGEFIAHQKSSYLGTAMFLGILITGVIIFDRKLVSESISIFTKKNK